MLIPYDLHYQPFTIRSAMFARELARRGHRVRIFYRALAPGERGNRVHFALPEGCEVSPHPKLSHPAGWRAVLEAVRDADVVHFQKSRPPYPAVAVLLGRALGKPVHQDWDDDQFAFWWQAARDSWHADAGLLPRAGRMVSCMAKAAVSGSAEWAIPKVVDTLGGASMYLRRRSIEWGCDPADVFPARVGVDHERFRPENRDEGLRSALGLRGPTVIFAGSFDVHPDMLFLAEALRVLFALTPEAQCLVVGGGFGRERLLRALGNVPAGAVVMTEGLVPFDAMPRYVASADLAALPFRDTPVNRSKSSLTLLESMASGLPVVTHDVGDIGWMAGEGAVIVPPGSPEAFAKALAGLVRDPARRAELGARARRRAVERFGWEHTVDYLEAAYYRAVAKKRNGGRPS